MLVTRITWSHPYISAYLLGMLKLSLYRRDRDGDIIMENTTLRPIGRSNKQRPRLNTTKRHLLRGTGGKAQNPSSTTDGKADAYTNWYEMLLNAVSKLAERGRGLE